MRRLAGAVTLTCLVASMAAAQRPTRARTIRETGRMTDPRVAESSGAIRGTVNPGLVWTLDDSGNPPILFAIDTTGRVEAAVRLDGAVNVDWETISIGPCGRSDDPCLYVGDLGDNLARRRSVTVYRLPEPALHPNPPVHLPVQDSLVIRYTSGAQDVEAMAVTAAGDLLLVGKGWRERPAVFVVPDSAWNGGRFLAAPVDTLPIETGLFRGALVTDAALSPDQRRLAVRTYREIYFFGRDRRNRFDLRRPEAVCDVSGREPQGEGIAYWDDRTLVLTSERLFGADGTVLLVRCADP